MAVFRVERTHNYTVMSNYHLRDKSLSLKAKGLLSQMLSLPEDWDYTLAGLARINAEGKDAIRAAVNELEKAGYVTRSRMRDEKGRLSGAEYIIREQPVFSAEPALEEPVSGNPTLEETTQLNKDKNKKTDSQSTEIFPFPSAPSTAHVPLLRKLARPPEDKPFGYYARSLAAPERSLTVIHRQLHGLLTPSTRRRLDGVSSTVSLFRQGHPDMVFYTEEDRRGGTMLCATISDLTAQLRQTLWRQERPAVLTSATLAVGEDFRRFKEETGLLTDSRVTESVTPSPFDYQQNCLLYLPEFPPKQKNAAYYDELAKEIAALLDAAQGHALALFTSYAAMSAVKERLPGHGLRYPLFTMGRSAIHSTEQFKASPGSVLLAAGAAWEGFDFPGDCVSLLIIPRLPFAVPDALKEKERENHPSLRLFIRAVVVPEMQIKLKQGFGRAIRTETDTCVVAILDERANQGKRYFEDMLAALPEMPITDSLKDVERFIRSVKGPDYFQEGCA